MKWLLDPSEYPKPNARIDGWKKLREVHAHVADIYVFPLEAFEYFLKNSTLEPEFEQAVLQQAQKMIDDNPDKRLLVRRAFVVPGLENPPGPRFLGLTNGQMVVDAVKELFAFAIAQKYHEEPNSQISGWLEVPSKLFDIDAFEKDPTSVAIPYGGYAISEKGRVEIYALYGLNEGVQSLVTDRYIVESRNRRLFVVRKEIPQKNLMLCTTNRQTKPLLVNVPVDIQFDQVMADGEIMEIARIVDELSGKYGSQRVEFSLDNQGIISPNEVADYFHDATQEDKRDIKVVGTVMVINAVEDIAKLTSVPAEQLESGKTIVMVGEKVIVDRDYDVLGTLTTWKNKLYVLYPGVAATQHAMRILADKGHRAFLVGNQKFGDSDQVQITSINGKIRVVNLSKTEKQEVVSLWDALLLGTELCGGKAQRLSQLKALGFQVPHGSVCTTVVFDQVAANLDGAGGVIDTLMSDYRKSNEVFAVRSSATIEDGREHSFAGLFDSYLNVRGTELTEKIILVLKSTFNKQVTDYLKAHPALAQEKLKMAVVVQQMVDARTAGVIFGAKVQTGNVNLVEIEANNGLAEAIVSGEAKEVESWRFDRDERRVIERTGPKYLSAQEARALFMLAERLREEFGGVPQDIEWAIDKTGQIWIVQSRDLYITN